jgi:UDP-glucose 4-epimerase
VEALMAARVLVTGGAGFIGSHVVALLRARGRSVRVLDDLSTGRAENLPGDVELVRASVTDPAVLPRVLEGVDTVIHLAAIASVTRSVESPRETHAVNLGGTVALAQAMVEAGVSRLVYASSAAVYGAVERDVHGEDDTPAPITPYAIDKLTGETYGRYFAQAHGLDVRALRFFNVYGPRQLPGSPYSGVISRLAARLLRGEPLIVYGDGHQTRDFIDVGDVAEVVVRHALGDRRAPVAMVMNVCNGEGASLLDLVAVLAGVTGCRPELRHEAERAGDIRHSRGATGRLEAWFPERPRTPLRDGLERVVAWMRSGASGGA